MPHWVWAHVPQTQLGCRGPDAGKQRVENGYQVSRKAVESGSDEGPCLALTVWVEETDEEVE